MFVADVTGSREASLTDGEEAGATAAATHGGTCGTYLQPHTVAEKNGETAEGLSVHCQSDVRCDEKLLWRVIVVIVYQSIMPITSSGYGGMRRSQLLFHRLLQTRPKAPRGGAWEGRGLSKYRLILEFGTVHA